MRTIVLLSLCFFLFQSSNCSAFGFKDVKRIIEQYDIKKLDDFMTHIPQVWRTNFVIMYDSKSEQISHAQFPRVIMYGEDAEFILAVNTGMSGVKGHNTLEMMEYHTETDEWEFRLIQFERFPYRAIISEANPTNCKRCHGNVLRPIWEPFPIWPGAAPEADRLKEADYIKLNHVRAGFEGDPRYRYLNLDENIRMMEQHTLKYSHAYRFHAKLSIVERKRVSKWIRSSIEYDNYKYAIVAALSDCEDIPSFIPKKIPLPFIATWQTRLNEVLKELKGAHYQHASLINEVEKNVTASIRYLFDNRGLETDHWATSSNSSLITTVGTVKFLNLVRDLREKDERLSSVQLENGALYRHLQRERFPALYTEEYRRSVENYCGQLKLLSLSALGS